MTIEIVERVARAIHNQFVAQQTIPKDCPTWDELLVQGHQGLARVGATRQLAQAAIKAMREPNPETVAILALIPMDFKGPGSRLPPVPSPVLLSDRWRQIIDTMLGGL